MSRATRWLADAAAGSGQDRGTLLLRDHRAVVDIDYTPRTYSIRYKDSSSLDYDGSSIHKNYNGWIENLDRAIRNRLLTQAAPGLGRRGVAPCPNCNAFRFRNPPSKRKSPR